jgi:hypothetical protein
MNIGQTPQTNSSIRVHTRVLAVGIEEVTAAWWFKKRVRKMEGDKLEKY